MAFEHDYDEDIYGWCNLTILANSTVLEKFSHYIENFNRADNNTNPPMEADGYWIKKEEKYLKMGFTYGDSQFDEKKMMYYFCDAIDDFNGKEYKVFLEIGVSCDEYEGCSYGIYRSGNWNDEEEDINMFKFYYSEYPAYDKNGNSRDSLNNYFITYINDMCELFLIENGINKGSIENARKNCEKSLKYANQMKKKYRIKN